MKNKVKVVYEKMISNKTNVYRTFIVMRKLRQSIINKFVRLFQNMKEVSDGLTLFMTFTFVFLTFVYCLVSYFFGPFDDHPWVDPDKFWDELIDFNFGGKWFLYGVILCTYWYIAIANGIKIMAYLKNPPLPFTRLHKVAPDFALLCLVVVSIFVFASGAHDTADVINVSEYTPILEKYVIDQWLDGKMRVPTWCIIYCFISFFIGFELAYDFWEDNVESTIEKGQCLLSFLSLIFFFIFGWYMFTVCYAQIPDIDPLIFEQIKHFSLWYYLGYKC